MLNRLVFGTAVEAVEISLPYTGFTVASPKGLLLCLDPAAAAAAAAAERLVRTWRADLMELLKMKL